MRLPNRATLLAAAILVGANAWPDDALDAAKKELAAKWSEVNSFSAVLEMKMDVRRSESNLSATGEGKVECIKKDGVEKSRVEITMDTTAPGAGPDASKTKQRNLRVFDGATLYTENSMMGLTRAVKTTKGNGAIVGGGKALFDQLEKNYTLAVRPNEKTGDRVARVIEGTPKPEVQQKAKVVRLYFDPESGSMLKSEILDETGKPQVTTIVKDIKINPEISEDRFTYTPPAGVELLDADAVKPAAPKPQPPAAPAAPATPAAPAAPATPAPTT